MKSHVLVPAVLAMLVSFTAHADVRDDGHAGGNGGDPTLLRQKLIKEFIDTSLRPEALAYMRNLDPSRIASEPARNALKDMNVRDVSTDIQDSSYVIQATCTDVGGQAGGGAIANQLGGDICLSVQRLAEIDASKAEIVGLVIHEHAHHFGYVDADYAIYKAVYETVSLADPAWSEADPAASEQALPRMKFVDPIRACQKLHPNQDCHRFWMGLQKPRKEAAALHEVYLTHEFEIQTTDVTQAQWLEIMGWNPSSFQKHENCPESFAVVDGVPACPNYPVENVSWNDAQNFIARLNSHFKGRFVYRLPTEAEWDYAARANYCFENDFHRDLLHQYAWFGEGFEHGHTHPVGSLKPNAYGLYDMMGNVQQWVQDWYGPYPTGAVADPIGPTVGERRVVRGLFWSLNLKALHDITYRGWSGGLSPNYSGDMGIFGFRLARASL